MARALACFLVALAMCWGAGGRVWSAEDDESFQDAAHQALDDYEQQKAEVVEGVSRPVESPPSPVAVQNNPEWGETFLQGSREKVEDSARPAASGWRDKKIEIALQMASYLFETGDKWPDNYSKIYSVSDKVKKSGLLVGGYGSYTLNFFKPLQSWRELFRVSPWPSFLKFEAEVSAGSLEYNSYATGTLKGFRNLDIDVRVIEGYDFQIRPTSVVSPFMGVGYRRYTDDTGGWEDYYVNGYAPYTTKYNFIYLLGGVEALYQLNQEWDLNAKLEGDFVLSSKIQYDLSEIPGPLPAYDVEAKENITVNLKDSRSGMKGFGGRASTKLIRKYKDFNIFVEPFLRFWKMGDSTPERILSTGTNGKEYISVGKPLWDPESYTIISGARMGVQF